MAEWLREFIAEGVVVVVVCQPYPLAHSTHDSILACLFALLTGSGGLFTRARRGRSVHPSRRGHCWVSLTAGLNLHGVGLLVFLTQRSVHPPNGLLIRAQR